MNGCIRMHPGLMVKQRDAKTVQAKEHARRAAALLLRLLFIITLFLNAGAPVFFVIPWSSPADALEGSWLSDPVSGKCHKARYVVDAELQYEVFSSCDASSTASSCYNSLTSFVCRAVKGDASVPHAHREHIPPRHGLDHRELDDNAIRPKVRRPHSWPAMLSSWSASGRTGTPSVA